MQRYQLDLSDFFSDHRQKVFVGKREKWKLISCLAKHVGTVFGLDNVFITNGDGVLFLEDDSLNVIRESDLLRVHSSTSLNVTQKVCAPKRAVANDTTRASVVNQNGKRKHESISNVVPIQHDRISTSGSESDDDDSSNVLPKIFVELESVSKKDDAPIDSIEKAKRKRIRKRKPKKSKQSESPQKVVVKTYGKGKVPAISQDNAASSQHIRFGKDEPRDEQDAPSTKDEPYRNLNKTTVARVVKAVLRQSDPSPKNDESPPIPEYVDDLKMDPTVVNSQRKKKPRKQHNSLEIKRELIETSTNRAVSPTWDSELDQAKEKFLSSYTGSDFWVTLQEALEHFPAISVPSVNDIIAYRLGAADQQQLPNLAFVERADDGDSDDCPALKLTLRRLDTALALPDALITCTLDQLTEIRLVATYQP